MNTGIMKFIHPEILWALGALAIPVIVHLFNFRRFKKVLFPNVSFLREIRQETQSKNKLKHLLILTARLLAVAAIVMAFAQPFIPAGKQEQAGAHRVTGIYLDNSFSMEAEDGGVRMLDLARNKAIEIVSAYGPADRFTLATNDFEGRHQRVVSQEEMIEWLQDVEVSPAVRLVSEAYSRLRESVVREETPNRSVFLISDFQQSTADLMNVRQDTSISLQLVPNGVQASRNLFIDSLWFESPVRTVNVPEVLSVRIRNTGAEDENAVPVVLTVNGQQKAVGAADVTAGGDAVLQLTYSNTATGEHHCAVSVDDSPVVFDNTMYFGYDVADKVLVTELYAEGSPSRSLSLVFDDNSAFSYTRMDAARVDFGALAQQNLVIVNQLADIPTGLQAELSKLMQEGGHVFIIPSAACNVGNYNNLLAASGAPQLGTWLQEAAAVSTVNMQHPLYRSVTESAGDRVSMPAATGSYAVDPRTAPAADVLLGTRSGLAFLSTGNTGRGRWYLLASPLSEEATDFERNWLFPVTMLNVANYSRANAPLCYTIGKDETIALKNVAVSGEIAFRVKGYSDSTAFIPTHRLAGPVMEFSMQHSVRTSGNYRLLQGDQVLAPLAFNYDRAESATAALSAAALEALTGEPALQGARVLTNDTASIRKGALERSEGKKLWWTFVVWALIWLAVEVLLIKFWR